MHAALIPHILALASRTLVRNVLLGLAAAVVVATAATSAAATHDPAWLRPLAVATSQRWFGAKPTRIDSIQYTRKIAVVLTFAHDVTYFVGSSPDGTSKVHGRIFRFALYRETHRTDDGRNFAFRVCRSRASRLHR